MYTIEKSDKLHGVCYDIRGPVLEHAQRMEEDGSRILKLNIGNPAPFDFAAPDEIIKDVILNLSAAEGYTHSKGLFAARKAIMQECQKLEITGVEIEDIYIGNGVSELITMATQALLNDGDEILVPSPDYPLWTAAVGLGGGKPVHYLCDEQSDWQPALDDIRSKISDRTRAIVIINPNNPTGAVYSESTLRAVNRLCKEHGLFHISDEAYEYFHYEGSEHFSPASIADSAPHTISLYSLSKAYGMAGWRVGYMVIPNTLETAIKKAQDTNLICPPLTSQFAAVAALEAGASWCHEQIREFSRVREMVLNRLDQLSDRVQVPSANGAFYVLLRVQSDRSDLELVEQLIREFGVALMPGSTFGVGATECGPTECALRIAYGALQPETVDEGMDRVVRGLKQLV